MPQNIQKKELTDEIQAVTERISANLAELERLGASPALLAELRAMLEAAGG